MVCCFENLLFFFIRLLLAVCCVMRWLTYLVFCLVWFRLDHRVSNRVDEVQATGG